MAPPERANTALYRATGEGYLYEAGKLSGCGSGNWQVPVLASQSLSALEEGK
jgi:hypothetical protein